MNMRVNEFPPATEAAACQWPVEWDAEAEGFPGQRGVLPP